MASQVLTRRQRALAARNVSQNLSPQSVIPAIVPDNLAKKPFENTEISEISVNNVTKETALATLYSYFPENVADANRLIEKIKNCKAYKAYVFKSSSEENWRDIADKEKHLLELIKGYRHSGVWKYGTKSKNADIYHLMRMLIRKVQQYHQNLSQIHLEEEENERSQLKSNSTSKKLNKKKNNGVDMEEDVPYLNSAKFCTSTPTTSGHSVSKKLSSQSNSVSTEYLIRLSTQMANPDNDSEFLNSLSSIGFQNGSIEDTNSNQLQQSCHDDKDRNGIHNSAVNNDLLDTEHIEDFNRPHPERPTPSWLKYSDKPAHMGENYPRQIIEFTNYPFYEAAMTVHEPDLCKKLNRGSSTAAAAADNDAPSKGYVPFEDWVKSLEGSNEKLHFKKFKKMTRLLVNRLICHIIGPKYMRQPYFDPNNIRELAAIISARYWPLSLEYRKLHAEFHKLERDGLKILPFGIKTKTTFKENFSEYLFKRFECRLNKKKEQMEQAGIENVWTKQKVPSWDPTKRSRGRPRKNPEAPTSSSAGTAAQKRRKSKVPKVIESSDEEDTDNPDYYIDPSDLLYLNSN